MTQWTPPPCSMFKSDRPFTPTINLCVCVCFQTIGKLGFGAELHFSTQTDKTQRHSGAACFHVLRSKCMPLVGQVLCLQYPPLSLSLQRLLHSHAQTASLHTHTPSHHTSCFQWNNNAHGKHRCWDVCEFSTLCKSSGTDLKWLTGWPTV